MKKPAYSTDIEWKEFTPEQAAKELAQIDQNTQSGLLVNRPRRRRTVTAYAADMACGNFSGCPETVKYDANGNCFDGQHRFAAIVKARCSIWLRVETGFPARVSGASTEVNIIDLVDGGLPRTFGTRLQLAGIPDGPKVVAAMKVIIRLCWASLRAVDSYPAILAILNQLGFKTHYAEIVKFVQSVADHRAHIIAPLAYYHSVSPAKAREFARTLFLKEQSQNSPVWALNMWLDKQAKSKRRGIAYDMMYAACAAIRAYDKGAPLTRIPAADTDDVLWLVRSNQKLLSQIQKITSVMPNE